MPASVIGTWEFSYDAVVVCGKHLMSGGDSLSACENGINVVENDPATGQYFVGRGGFPNADGHLQMDAAIMKGKDTSFGAVAALEGISTPISVARKVLEESPHSFLVGDGAKKFAISHGFTIESEDKLQTKLSMESYKKFLSDQHQTEQTQSISSESGHDTLGLIAVDRAGDIVAGVSTSGMMFKHAGRVGDSPLPGCGLYADNLAGAACCTGDGDKILRFCPSFHVIQLMKQGSSPSQACKHVIAEITERMGDQNMFQIGIIAMDMEGHTGACSALCDKQREGVPFKGFPVCNWNEGLQEPVTELHQNYGE